MVLVAYLILRSRSAEPATPVRADTRLPLYLHVAVLTFWGLVAVGLSTLIYGPLHQFRTTLPPEDTGLRETLAFSTAVLFVSVPALAVHVWLAMRALSRASVAAAPVVGRMADGLRMILIVIGALTATLAVVVLIFWGFGRLFQVGEIEMEEVTTLSLSVLPASLLSVAAGFWLLPHGRGVEDDAAT